MNSSQTFPKIKKNRHFLTPSMWSGKDPTKKKNYKPISLTNTDAKVLNIILIDRTHWHTFSNILKRITCHDQMGFTPGTKGWFNTWNSIDVKYHINRMKGGRKTTWSSQLMQKNHLVKFNTFSWWEMLDKLQWKENIIRARNEKTTVNITLVVKAFPLRSGDHWCPLSPVLVTTVLKVLGRLIRQEKEIKVIQIGKEEVKLCLQMMWS